MVAREQRERERKSLGGRWPFQKISLVAHHFGPGPILDESTDEYSTSMIKSPQSLGSECVIL